MRRMMAAAAASCLAACSGGAGEAPDPPAPSGPATVLREALESADGLEVIMQDVRFAANMELPRHYHPGEEYIYVLEGEVTHIEEGQEDRLYRAGEALRIGVGKTHAARTGAEPARAVIFRVHRKGEPERVLVE